MKLCRMSEKKLKKDLLSFLYNHQYKVKAKEGYITAEGTIPICLVAHMDTVFRWLPTKNGFIHDPYKKVLWFPGGAGFDDRAGIYAIKEIVECGYRPHIIFTEGEESGGIGARKLVDDYKEIPFSDCKALIQLDRMGKDDAVFYNCDNLEFEKYIEKFGFFSAYGTFSDISILAPEWRVPAVNLSIGFEDEHTSAERLYYGWCFETIEKVKDILDAADKMPRFKYIPYVPQSNIHYTPTAIHDSCLLCGSKDSDKLRHVKENNGFTFCLCDSCFADVYGHF